MKSIDVDALTAPVSLAEHISAASSMPGVEKDYFSLSKMTSLYCMYRFDAGS